MRKIVALALSLGMGASCAQTIDESTFAGYVSWVEGLLGMRFNPEQRQHIRRDVAGYVSSRNSNSMKTVQQAAAHWRNIEQQPPELAETAFRMSRPDTLISLHKAAREGHGDSKFLLDAYYQANPILAGGKPDGLPLTRDMVEGDLALKHWYTVEIHRQNAPPPDARVIADAIRTASQRHAAMTGPEQVQFARQAGEWARVSYAWPRASAMDKLIARNDLGGRLSPQEQAQLQQFLAGINGQLNGMVSQHRNGMLGGTIAAMKENSDTIMGRGTVWNPATNRWEQQGGIVTEFDGRVRVP